MTATLIQQALIDRELHRAGILVYADGHPLGRPDKHRVNGFAIQAAFSRFLRKDALRAIERERRKMRATFS